MGPPASPETETGSSSSINGERTTYLPQDFQPFSRIRPPQIVLDQKRVNVRRDVGYAPGTTLPSTTFASLSIPSKDNGVADPVRARELILRNPTEGGEALIPGIEETLKGIKKELVGVRERIDEMQEGIKALREVRGLLGRLVGGTESEGREVVLKNVDENRETRHVSPSEQTGTEANTALVIHAPENRLEEGADGSESLAIEGGMDNESLQQLLVQSLSAESSPLIDLDSPPDLADEVQPSSHQAFSSPTSPSLPATQSQTPPLKIERTIKPEREPLNPPILESPAKVRKRDNYHHPHSEHRRDPIYTEFEYDRIMGLNDWRRDAKGVGNAKKKNRKGQKDYGERKEGKGNPGARAGEKQLGKRGREDEDDENDEVGKIGGEKKKMRVDVKEEENEEVEEVGVDVKESAGKDKGKRKRGEKHKHKQKQKQGKREEECRTQ